ncbi:hypothetical protein, partial [Campylobacter fetus]|uniref:hypothetical protein n=1 Tax=Campylobacter fetus TaxID=196 RepID=UPI000828D745
MPNSTIKVKQDPISLPHQEIINVNNRGEATINFSGIVANIKNHVFEFEYLRNLVTAGTYKGTVNLNTPG